MDTLARGSTQGWEGGAAADEGRCWAIAPRRQAQPTTGVNCQNRLFIVRPFLKKGRNALESCGEAGEMTTDKRCACAGGRYLILVELVMIQASPVAGVT